MSATTGPLFVRLCELLNVSQAEFGKKTGIIQQTLSSLMAGKSKPGYETLAKIKKTYPLVNLNWLVAAEEPAFTDGTRGSKLGTPREEFENKYANLRKYGPNAEDEPSAKPAKTVEQLERLLDIQQREAALALAQKDTLIVELTGSVASLSRQLELAGKIDGNQPDAPGMDSEPRQAPGFKQHYMQVLREDWTGAEAA